MNGMNLNTKNIDWVMDYTFLFLWMIILIVSSIFLSLLSNFFNNNKYFEFPKLEFLWTFIPGMIVLLIAIPSLSLLYEVEQKNNQNITFKTTGHQWYWNYDYFNKINFDSYLESSSKYKPRILDTDNHIILPLGKILNIITSEDVIHSWSVPSLGVKMDANPGRLNSIFFFLNTPGIFYGHCSEICGANHSFMPIVLESVNFLNFKQWILNY